MTIALFLGPVAAGLLGTVLPSLGYLPVLGGERLSLEPWRQLASAPGLATALRLSLVSGFVSTAAALALTILVFAAGHGTRTLTRAKQSMTPVLAVPHLAMAVGLAFLIAPSGWLARLASPWLTGWDRPPDLALVQDHHGLALALGLALKETPFLILMTFAALGQVRADDRLRMARSLGYGPVCAWLKVVLPRVYPQIRLPVYAVLAYSLSVVDMAIVLGPTTPPTLAVLVLRWLNDPDLAMRFQAAAGACLQFAIVVAAIGLWRGLELAVAVLARSWLVGGG
ncbi:MAG: ABC transporter permease, partial [Geminicoccaceae bacterium]